MMDARVDAALNTAIAALNEKKYAEAKASVDQLKLGWLSSYELGMKEAVLFRIANAEQKYGEARQHLVNAIESCGLTGQGVADAQDAIKRIDALLAPASPP